MDVKIKLDKEQKKLQSLNEQKIDLDEKITEVTKEITRLKGIINQKRFDEIEEVLDAKGLSIEEVLKAVKCGDVLFLQERIEEITKKE